MAKTARGFGGTNTYGTHVEVAESVTGKWFQRAYEYNGYAKAWSKWIPFTPSWSTTITNAYTGEVSEREEPALEYGFSILKEYVNEKPNYRLPA